MNCMNHYIADIHDQRSYWLDVLLRIIDPVLSAGTERTLHREIPHGDEEKWRNNRKDSFAVLEAVGRTLCGLAPWLEKKQLDPEEEKLRHHYATLARKTIDAITDPSSPDRVPFYVPAQKNGGTFVCQSLVDAAFLSHAIVRAPSELFHKLDSRIRNNLVNCLKETRLLRPPHNNWILFPGMVEAALKVCGEKPDLMRVDMSLYQHEQWYKGDGIYGDGPSFHWDYYNSYVIQPMMADIAGMFAGELSRGSDGQKRYATIIKRASRYAFILERMISADGTFPAVGRSLTYRTGAFQLLAEAVYEGFLPEGLSPGGTRRALTKVIRRCFEADGTFDEKGWLSEGLCGHQPGLAEPYICAGSLYLCTTVFLPLGLDSSDPFWTSPDEPHSAELIWSGADVPADHAITV